MSEKKSYDRYYKKGQYEAAIGTFAVAIVFVFVAILSLVFIALDIDFISLKTWGFWLFIPAFFIFIGGFEQLYTNYKYKRSIKAAIAERNYQGTHKLENIALETGIKPSDVLRVMLDLRQKGEIRYKFDPETGEINLGQKVEYEPVEDFTPPKKVDKPLKSSEKNFCVYCGHQLRPGAAFCENCGSKIE
ncbi:MAG: zinc-ribbon domain-containing protein [Candidatus Lokiarchaeota archaeon]|nr:zinc-ribbon domain-containing protein [Candidatus Lokiarchaeota archaeon]MBD3198771.1 zinc-ribbon domain-containing protein [Candidatus Lokiarchaeota archaeon]